MSDKITVPPSNTSTASRRLEWPRNTLFLAVADFTMPEIHYFWLLQACMASKYTISGCRRFYNARNTLFLAVADFTTPEIHYFWLSQVCMASKYSISERRSCATIESIPRCALRTGVSPAACRGRAGICVA